MTRLRCGAEGGALGALTLLCGLLSSCGDGKLLQDSDQGFGSEGRSAEGSAGEREEDSEPGTSSGSGDEESAAGGGEQGAGEQGPSSAGGGAEGETGGVSPGQDSEDGTTPGMGSGAGSAEGGEESTCTPADAVPEALPLRRLTSAQFKNSLSVLFPGVDLPELSLPSPIVADGFDNSALSQPNNPLLIESEYAATDTVASSAVAQLGAWAPCEEQSVECLETIAEELSGRAFRRTPSADELSQLGDYAAAEFAASGFEAAAHDVIQAILLSPQTLYRLEYGTQSEHRLTGEEVATRLAFFLWRQSPDAELLAAARQGELDDAEGVSSHARRMFDDERARDMMEDFMSQWLRLDAVSQLQLNAERYPELDEELRQSLRASLERFIQWALWEENSMDALLRSDVVFVDDRLAELLSVASPGAELQPVSVEHRHGILTQPGVLASTSHGSVHSPILRGLKVLESFLCVHIAAPPPEVNAAVEPKPEGEALTTRQHVEETHSGSSECRGCHTLIDGVGFAFENYDALGRYVTEEDGVPVDPSGLAPLESGMVEVQNALELAQALESSRQVRECVGEHLYRYALGVPPDGRGPQCLVEELAGAWEESAGDPAGLVDRLVRSDIFLRLPEGVE